MTKHCLVSSFYSMKKYSIIVLTDHSNHSKENSLYALVNEFLHNERISNVHVASRAIRDNHSFFENPLGQPLHATSAKYPLAFSENGTFFDHPVQIDVSSFDLVLLRLPHPVSDHFLLSLKELFNNTLIINDPKGIIKTSIKTILLNYQDICPPMKVCTSIDDVISFSGEFECVLKPLKDYGGKGIVKISGNTTDDGIQLHDTLQYMESIRTRIEKEGMLAVKFLRNVDQGDKRTIVVGGEIMASSLRLPAKGKWLCNVSQGGISENAAPTNEEYSIVERIRTDMKENGIHIYGIDTLVNDEGIRILSEINTLSVGGFPQAQAQTGKPIIKFTINSIINLTDEFYYSQASTHR